MEHPPVTLMDRNPHSAHSLQRGFEGVGYSASARAAMIAIERMRKRARTMGPAPERARSAITPAAANPLAGLEGPSTRTHPGARAIHGIRTTVNATAEAATTRANTPPISGRDENSTARGNQASGRRAAPVSLAIPASTIE